MYIFFILREDALQCHPETWTRASAGHRIMFLINSSTYNTTTCISSFIIVRSNYWHGREISVTQHTIIVPRGYTMSIVFPKDTKQL